MSNIKIIAERSDIVAIADAVRTKTGTSNEMTLEQIAININNININSTPAAITPTITVSSGGLITATAGDKSATKQLTTQAAKTITPSTSNQTAVESGRYTTGAVTVKGDSNLVAGNIKKGVSIFGVSGTHEGGTTEDLSTELTTQDSLLTELATVLASKASGGSGSGSVETCTVTINDQNYGMIRLVYEDDAGTYHDFYDEEGLGTVEFPSSIKTPKGSCVIITIIAGSTVTASVNCTMFFTESYSGGSFITHIIKITGDNATIDIL